MNIAVKKALLLLFVSAIAGSLNCAFGQFIYLANGGNDVSAWRLDARTRVLTTVPGSPFAAGAAPVDIAVDPTSKFVYVANAASNDVSAYRIETSTGALLPVTRSPFAAGIAPAALEIDPTGRFVYVANSRSSDISAYTMDSATGALLPVPGSPFATQIVPSALVSDITGKFLYVTHSASGSASTYGIDPATGALTRVSANPFPANTVPLSRSGSGLLSPGLVEDRTGQVAYEANDQSHDLNLFAMDARTRAWTSVSGSPLDGLLKLDGRLKPRAIAISAASRTDTPPTGTALVTGFTSGAPRNNFTGGFGMAFTVGATPLNVTALGRIHITGNTGSHTVKLVSASDAVDVPGGSVTIQLPSGQAEEFAYASLATPVTLDAGASYYLTSSEIIGGDQFYTLGAVTTTGAVTVQSGVVFWTGAGYIPVGSPGRSFVPVNLLYSIPGTPPSVAITAPAPGSTVLGNNVTVSATASAATGLTIAGVQFQVDNQNYGAPVGRDPFNVALDTTKLSNGFHTLTAIATDSANTSATSSPVGFTVNNNPAVAITAPSPGATVSGSGVTLTATSAAAPGLTIASVQFKVDNVNQGQPGNASPYSILLDSTGLTNATHTLVAVATDSAGNTTASAPVSVAVNNTATSVTITAPTAGGTVSGHVPVSATATAGAGRTIVSVQFRVDDTTLGTPVTAGPRYTIVLDTATLTNGAHSLTAVATDSVGATATSAPVSITVGNSGPPPAGTALVTGFTSGALRNNFTGGFGMVFTVGATPLNVTALGRIYITGNTGSHTVKLVSASDAVDVPGGSVTIQLPSGQAGEFAYASLATPVTLDAGASYYLTSSETIDGDQFYDLGAVTTTGAVTVQSGVVLWTGGFIPLGSPGRSFVPVNFLYTLAP